MTDYPANKKSSKGHIWEKMERARKWRGVLAIFICVFLGFFIINGILRAFSLKNHISASKWNDRMPYAAAINTTVPIVVVFNKDIGEVVVLTVPGDILIPEDGKAGDVNADDGQELTKTLTGVLGLDVRNYVILKDKTEAQTAEIAYRDFTSVSTLIKIVTGRNGPGVGSTNVTRIDLLRLWWQVKSSGIKSPKVIDLVQFSQDISPQKTHFDRELFHLAVDKYFGIAGVADQNIKVEIKNSSGVVGAGQIGSEIASSLGFNVIRVETGEAKIVKCNISGGPKNSAASLYLANIFSCDIVSSLSGTQSAPITVDLGSDFAKRLF